MIDKIEHSSKCLDDTIDHPSTTMFSLIGSFSFLVDPEEYTKV